MRMREREYSRRSLSYREEHPGTVDRANKLRRALLEGAWSAVRSVMITAASLLLVAAGCLWMWDYFNTNYLQPVTRTIPRPWS
jgi:hypothetical protein